MVDSTATPVFVNKVDHTVRMKVGNNQHFSYVASIEDGREYKLNVKMNETYREFMLGHHVHVPVHVTSDDCCDFQCITIKEMADGKIELLRASSSGTSSAANEKKPSRFSRWMDFLHGSTTALHSLVMTIFCFITSC